MARAPRQSWVQCVRDQLKQRGFGDKRADEIETRLQNLADRYHQSGEPMPEERATRETMASVAAETARKSAVALDTMERIALDNEIIHANLTKQKIRIFGGEGAGPIAAAPFQYDPRVDMRGGKTDVGTAEKMALGRLMAVGEQIASDAGKGKFGRQRGVEHLPNIVRAVLDGPDATKDEAAKSMAKAWIAMTDTGLALFRQAGGFIEGLPNYMPQNWSAAKIANVGVEDYVQFHLRPGVLAWDRMAHPDGSPILPAERESYLRDVYRTITQDGANKLTPESASGRGSSLGNQLDTHRQLHYANADAWLGAFDKYADGTIFDVMMRHVGSTARQIALVQTFGPNPTMGAMRYRAQVLRATADYAPNDAVLVRKTQAAMAGAQGFDGLARKVFGHSTMNEFNPAHVATAMTADVLRANQLGSSSIVSAATDLPAMMFHLFTSGQFRNAALTLGDYARTMADVVGNGRDLDGVMARNGYIHDSMLSGLAEQTTRFVAPLGRAPGIARAVAGLNMRLALQSLHDKAIRYVAVNQQTGFLYDMRKRTMDKLPAPFARIMAHHGITAADWDAFRLNCPPAARSAKAKWLVPLHILGTDLSNKEELFRKFGGMVENESYLSFMDRPSMAVGLSQAPGGLMGAITQSLLMYKSFGLTLMLTHGRLAMVAAPFQQSESAFARGAGRMAYYGGLAGALTLGGALSVQMYNLISGRDTESALDPRFWAHALLAGGGLGLMGEVLFDAATEGGRGISDVAVGPILDFLGEVGNTGYVMTKFAASQLGDPEWAKTGGRGTQLADVGRAAMRPVESVIPGRSLFWSRLAFRRYVLDGMERAIDPQAFYRSARQQQRNDERAGAPFFWAPGQGIDEARSPNFDVFRDQ